MTGARPIVAITVGDPSGIGPEIALKASRDPRVLAVCQPKLYGPHAPADARVVSCRPGERRIGEGGACGDRRGDDRRAAAGSQAVVTAPINKEAFAAGGTSWPGHTELLAHLCGVSDVAMMFWSEQLRVVLATIHVPLKDVPATLTEARCCGPFG